MQGAPPAFHSFNGRYVRPQMRSMNGPAARMSEEIPDLRFAKGTTGETSDRLLSEGSTERPFTTVLIKQYPELKSVVKQSASGVDKLNHCCPLKITK